jgi:hypothetical protein
MGLDRGGSHERLVGDFEITDRLGPHHRIQFPQEIRWVGNVLQDVATDNQRVTIVECLLTGHSSDPFQDRQLTEIIEIDPFGTKSKRGIASCIAAPVKYGQGSGQMGKQEVFDVLEVLDPSQQTSVARDVTRFVRFAQRSILLPPILSVDGTELQFREADIQKEELTVSAPE